MLASAQPSSNSHRSITARRKRQPLPPVTGSSRTAPCLNIYNNNDGLPRLHLDAAGSCDRDHHVGPLAREPRQSPTCARRLVGITRPAIRSPLMGPNRRAQSPKRLVTQWLRAGSGVPRSVTNALPRLRHRIPSCEPRLPKGANSTVTFTEVGAWAAIDKSGFLPVSRPTTVTKPRACNWVRVKKKGLRSPPQ
jgi:hypothetical protein